MVSPMKGQPMFPGGRLRVLEVVRVLVLTRFKTRSRVEIRRDIKMKSSKVDMIFVLQDIEKHTQSECVFSVCVLWGWMAMEINGMRVHLYTST